MDESLFYNGRYGSPLTYARLLDLAEKHGFAPSAGTRVFDFGYGSIGHLRMLAQTGLELTARDVDELLPSIYAKCSGPCGSGSVQLQTGRFSAKAAVVQKSGTGYDLFMSKNKLKRGYILSEILIELGVTDEKYLQQVAAMLNPGGLFRIYTAVHRKRLQTGHTLQEGMASHRLPGSNLQRPVLRCWSLTSWTICQPWNWVICRAGMRGAV